MVHEVSIDAISLEQMFLSTGSTGIRRIDWHRFHSLSFYLFRLILMSNRCRHGGHAHHIVGWFSKQKVCPVAGCDCECEFDAAINITRPAICVAADD